MVVTLVYHRVVLLSILYSPTHPYIPTRSTTTSIIIIQQTKRRQTFFTHQNIQFPLLTKPNGQNYIRSDIGTPTPSPLGSNTDPTVTPCGRGAGSCECQETKTTKFMNSGERVFRRLAIHGSWDRGRGKYIYICSLR